MAELDLDHVATLSRVFMESRLLLTAAELDLFTRLAKTPRTSAQLARETGWDARALEIVLDALVVLGLMDKRLEQFQTSKLALDRLTEQGVNTILPSVLHALSLWEGWSRLTERVVGTGKRPPREDLRAFIDTMDALAPRLAPGLAAQAKLPRGGRLLDLGGGSGAYTIAFVERDRSIKATLFDRPEVLPLCREYLEAADCARAVTLVGGDFLRDELPGPQDLVLLSAIVHSLSLAECRNLFGRAFQALCPGGRLLLRDHVMSEDRLRPRAGALFAVNMLVMTEGGSTYTFRELQESLEAVGFVGVHLVQHGERMDALVEAHRPESNPSP